MNNHIFIKPDIKEKLNSPDSIIELSNSSTEFSPYFITPRKELISNLADSINNNTNLAYISGFQGTGKSKIIDFVLDNCEKNVFKYKFDCFETTNLDDIVLGLFNFINALPIKKQIEHRSSSRQNTSIDEKLLVYLKNIKAPLFIVFDSFQNLINDDNEIIDSEILHFINYLLTLPTIRVIIGSRTTVNTAFNTKYRVDYKMGGIDENNAIEFLKSNNIQAYNQVLYSAFQPTRGYPLCLNLLVNTVNIFKIPIFDLIQEYASITDSFELFLAKKIFSKLTSVQKLILNYLSTFRHNITADVLLILDNNIKNEDISFLINTGLINQNESGLYIQDFTKIFVYDSISVHNKAIIHNKLHNFYEVQIPKKPSERALKISRKTMHSEHYYHLMCSNKNEKKYKNIGQNKNELYNISSSLNHRDISYIASTISDLSLITPKDSHFDENLGSDNKTIVGDSELISTSRNSTEDIIIELSDEEKHLIQDDTSDFSIDIDKVENNSNIIEIEPNIEQHISVESYITIASKSESDNNIPDAIDAYSKAIQLTTNDSQQAYLCEKLASLKILQGLPNEAFDMFDKAISLYRSFNDIDAVNSCLLKLGKAYSDNFQHDSALKQFYKIIEQGIDNVASSIQIEAFSEIADVYEYRQDYNSAISYYNNALNTAQKHSDVVNLAKIYFKLALIYDDLQHYDDAFNYYKKSIFTSNNSEQNVFLAESYANLGDLYYEKGQINECIESFKKSLSIDIQKNNLDGVYHSYSKLGNLYSEKAEFNTVVKYFSEEIKVAKELNNKFYIASSYLELGDAYLSTREHEKAIKCYLLARKYIDDTVSTDSKEKIERRFRQIIAEIGKNKFNRIVDSLKK